MTTAIVLINTERTKINLVGEQLAGINGITEVFSVGGSVDFVAVVRVASNDALAELITEKINQIEGIIKTETMVAFRAFSKSDFAGMFDMQ